MNNLQRLSDENQQSLSTKYKQMNEDINTKTNQLKDLIADLNEKV